MIIQKIDTDRADMCRCAARVKVDAELIVPETASQTLCDGTAGKECDLHIWAQSTSEENVAWQRMSYRDNDIVRGQRHRQQK